MWLPILVGTPYLIVGIGFVMAQVWARMLMLVLLVIAALFFAYLLLMAGFLINHSLIWFATTALGFTAYSAVFILVSEASRLLHQQEITKRAIPTQ